MNATPTIRAGAAPQRWPHSPQAVGQARHQLAAALDGWGLADFAEGAALVLSELMTNALRHVRPTEVLVIETRFVPMDGGVRIEVYDAGADRPELRKAAVDEEGGRGLALVDALTGGRWGVRGSADGGKAVWAFIGPGAKPTATPRTSAEEARPTPGREAPVRIRARGLSATTRTKGPA